MAKNSEKESSVFEKFMPVLLVVVVGLSFLVGILWQKVNNIEGKDNINGQEQKEIENNPTMGDGKLSADQVKKIPSLSDSDHLFGSKDAEVLLIEYSDFECPYCVRFHPTAKQAVENYNGKVAWVYRHFPLETLHTRAYPSVIASECVAKISGNDIFWKYTDLIFSDQEKYLTDSGLKSGAQELGVNVSEYDSCISSNDFENQIRQGVQKASKAGISGTPATFVVNKKGEAWLVPGALPYESLKSVIDQALGN